MDRELGRHAERGTRTRGRRSGRLCSSEGSWHDCGARVIKAAAVAETLWGVKGRLKAQVGSISSLDSFREHGFIRCARRNSRANWRNFGGTSATHMQFAPFF